MVERAAREPTVEEIVGGLRETRQDAGRVQPFTVVGAQPSGTSAVALRGADGRTLRNHDTAADADYGNSATDFAALREQEIERLLSENARLNGRVMSLLRVIEREGWRTLDLAGGQGGEVDRAAVVREVRAAVESELRPVLLVLLRLLESRNADPAGSAQTSAATPADSVSEPDPRRDR
jgi:hypothetical protein